MTRYSKMIVALIGAIGTWAATYFPDNHNVQIAVGLASALVTVLTVYVVPNTPPAGQPSDPNISEQDPPVAAARKRPAPRRAAGRRDRGVTAVEVIVAILIAVVALVLIGALR